MTRTCESCSKEFEAKSARARFCSSTCRSRAHRSPGHKRDAGSAGPAKQSVGPVAGGQLLVRTTEALVKVGKLDTYAGQQAIALAQRIENPFDTGSAIASLSKELSRVMDGILAAAEQTVDPLDELRKRRDAKRAG